MNELVQLLSVYATTARPLIERLLRLALPRKSQRSAPDERAELFGEIRRMTSILEMGRRDLWRR